MYGQNYNQFGYNTPAMPYLPDYRQQQNQQQVTTNISWIYVNGVDGARGQIVQPGQTVWMMDNSEPFIYVKAVDSMGTASLKAFRLTEVNTQNSIPSPAVDLSEYANRSDLDGLIDRVKAIEDLIGGLNS